MTSLTSNDINVINNIIDANKNIYSLYIKLYNLELLNQKNSDEYKKYIEYIRLVKEELEDDLYKSLNLNFDKILLILKHLGYSSIKYDNLLNLDFSDIYNRRIIKKLISDLKNKYSENIIKEDVEDIFKLIHSTSLKEKLLENLDDKIYSSIQISSALEQDIQKSILFFLEEEINRNNNSNELYPELLRIKYNSIFCDKCLEDEVVNNNFIINPCPNVYSVINMFGYNQDLFFEVISMRFKKEVDKCIKSFLYDDVSDIDIIYRKCIIRSLLNVLNEEELYNLNYEFNDLINSNNYLSKYPNNDEKENIIKNLFRNINNDKKKIMKLYR